jgi:hypothetical protein
MQALLWGIPNTHVNALCLRTAFTTLQPDPARKRSQSWQLPRYRTCGTPANRRSVGKRSKRSDRQFSFPLIRKSATSSGPLGRFSDLRKPVAFPKIRKSATTNLKTGGASALPFLRPFSRWHCVRRGKVEGRRYTVLYTYGFDSSTPEVPAIASRLTHYWMRHPHPLISLLSLMLLCSIRATSHEQPLDDLPLSSRRLPSMRITAACARSPPISVT